MASKAGKKTRAKKRIGEATRARMRARGDASAERVKKLVSDAVFRSAGASAAKEIAEAFDEAASLHPPGTTLRDLAAGASSEGLGACYMQVGLSPCGRPAQVRVRDAWICEAHAWEYLDERRVIAAEDGDPLRVKLEAQPKTRSTMSTSKGKGRRAMEPVSPSLQAKCVNAPSCPEDAVVEIDALYLCFRHAREFIDALVPATTNQVVDELRRKLEVEPKFVEATRTVRKVHWLKCEEEQYDAVARGEKHYEVRRSDRDYRVGDHLVLRRWSPAKGAYTAPHSAIRVEVTYLTPGGRLGLPVDTCVMSIAHVSTAGALCCAIHARGHERSVPRFESVR